jgi:hypothetical protein
MTIALNLCDTCPGVLPVCALCDFVPVNGHTSHNSPIPWRSKSPKHLRHSQSLLQRGSSKKVGGAREKSFEAVEILIQRICDPSSVERPSAGTAVCGYVVGSKRIREAFSLPKLQCGSSLSKKKDRGFARIVIVRAVAKTSPPKTKPRSD